MRLASRPTSSGTTCSDRYAETASSRPFRVASPSPVTPSAVVSLSVTKFRFGLVTMTSARSISWPRSAEAQVSGRPAVVSAGPLVGGAGDRGGGVRRVRVGHAWTPPLERSRARAAAVRMRSAAAVTAATTGVVSSSGATTARTSCTSESGPGAPGSSTRSGCSVTCNHQAARAVAAPVPMPAEGSRASRCRTTSTTRTGSFCEPPDAICAQRVPDARVGEPLDQGRAGVGDLGLGQRQLERGFVPQLLDRRAADRVVHRLGHRVVAELQPEGGEERVRAVQQPQLPLLVRGDVVDDPDAGRLPRGSVDAVEGVLEHPLGERLGDDGDPVSGERTRQFRQVRDVGVGGRGRDPVDHRARERDVHLDPVAQVVVRDGVEHGIAEDRPVVRQVVETDQRDAPGASGTAGVEPRDQPRRHVRPGPVALLGDRQRDDGRLGGRDHVPPGCVVAARVGGHDRCRPPRLRRRTRLA